MNLKEFYGKKVHIVDALGNEWEGIVDTYCYPEDNDSGKESIIVKCNDKSIEFEENDIKDIQVIVSDDFYGELKKLAEEVKHPN